jgi:hypothetical protein
VIAKQRIHVGSVHPDARTPWKPPDTTWRIYDEDGLVAEVARTTTKSLASSRSTSPNHHTAG